MGGQKKKSARKMTLCYPKQKLVNLKLFVHLFANIFIGNVKNLKLIKHDLFTQCTILNIKKQKGYS